MNTPKHQTFRSTRAALYITLSCLTSLTAIGQDTATPADDEVIELSPFVVDTSRDIGYLASETLGGTRLRTDVRDVGSSVTILTEEFLDDLGATSMSEAFDFTPSAGENEGDITTGNSSFNVGIWDSNRPIRLRGFGFNAGTTRDFFETFSNGDRYNVEQFTISRGPNSMLFGIGGPAGVTIATTKRAKLFKNQTSIEIAADDQGSRRASLDHNQVVVKDKFAVRVNALYDDKQQSRYGEGEYQKRITAGLTWKPAKNTKISAMYEDGLREWSAFGKVLPTYRDYARWNYYGRPTIDFVPRNYLTTANSNWRGGNQPNDYLDINGNAIPIGPDWIRADGRNALEVDLEEDGDGLVNNWEDFSRAANNNTPGAITLMFKQQYLTNGGDASIDSSVWGARWSGNLAQNFFHSSGTQRANIPPGMDDPFGVPDDVTLYPASERYPMQTADFKWGQVFVEQKVTDDLFVEYAFNYAEQFRENTPEWSAGMLWVDVNRYLADGTQNPYFLKPYNVYNLQINENFDDTTSHRLTAAYSFDLTENEGWTRWLGRHDIGLLGSLDEYSSYTNTLRPVNISNPPLNNDFNSGANELRLRNYFFDGAPRPIGAFEVRDMLATINQQDFLRHPSTVEARTGVDYMFVPRVSQTPDKREIESYSLAWQGRFLNSRLVTTFGYRRDKVDTLIADNPNTRPIEGTPYTSYYYGDELTIPDEPFRTDVGINRSYSVVYHLLKQVSLTYSKSSHFDPPDSIFPTIDGGVTGPSTGETEDYGIRFYLLDSKLIASINYFETTSESPSTGFFQTTNDTNDNLSRFRNVYKTGENALAADGSGITFAYFSDMLDEYQSEKAFLRDYEITQTTGYEFTLTYNPNENWRMYFSASVNENELVDRFRGVQDYQYNTGPWTNQKYTGFATQEAYADELDKVAAGNASSVFAEYDPSLELHREHASTQAAAIRAGVADDRVNLENELNRIGIQENRNGKYNVNGVITYRFTDGRLKGLNIGPNFRYRSDPIAGYYLIPNEDGSFTNALDDVDRPIYGDGFFNLGAVVSYNFPANFLGKNTRVNLQLNVYNLLNDTDNRLIRVEYDTEGYYGEKNAIVPFQYKIVEPRYYRLSMTVKF